MITITLDEEKAELLIRFFEIMKREKSLILKERNSFEELCNDICNRYYLDINEKRNEFGLPIIKENVE